MFGPLFKKNENERRKETVQKYSKSIVREQCVNSGRIAHYLLDAQHIQCICAYLGAGVVQTNAISRAWEFVRV